MVWYGLRTGLVVWVCYWLEGQQWTEVSLINTRQHIQYVYIVQYYSVLINEESFTWKTDFPVDIGII